MYYRSVGIAQANEVIPRLFVGGVSAACNLSFLRRSRISHILVVGNNVRPLFPQNFVYEHITIADSIDADLLSHFLVCFNFIDRALSSGGGVLVHCFAGASRSVTVIVGYLMHTKKAALSASAKTCC